MSRWEDVKALHERGRPGTALDRALDGFPDQLAPSDFMDLRTKLPALVEACPPAVFSQARRRQLEVAAQHLSRPSNVPTAQKRTGIVSFPVIGASPDDDHLVEVIVQVRREGPDTLADDAAFNGEANQAVFAALAAVRAELDRSDHFQVTVRSGENIDGPSLGLATALAAVSVLDALEIADVWCATGEITNQGAVRPVSRLDRKVRLLATEAPNAKLLVPVGAAAAQRVVPVSTLAEAIALVFAPDLAAAEKEYLDWILRSEERMDDRHLAGAGVPTARLARPLRDLFVEPTFIAEDWLLIGLQRARELQSRIANLQDGVPARSTLAEEFRALTGRPYREGEEAQPRRMGAAELGSSHVLVVMGDPGAGKSTFLQASLLTAARVALTENGAGDHPLPIHAHLSAFDATKAGKLTEFLLSYVKEQLEGVPRAAIMVLALAERLRKARVWLLLDGLNEMADADRRAMLLQLDHFLASHTEARLTLTARDWAYAGARLRSADTVVRLAPLTDEQRWTLLQNLTLAAPHARDALGLSFVHRTDWAGNPLFLTLAALLAADDARRLRHPAELFERVLLRFASERGHVDSREAALRLERWGNVAYLFRSGGRHAMTERQWVRLLQEAGESAADAPNALRMAWQQWGLLQREGNRYAFFHESLEEYLAAVHATREPENLAESLGKLTRTADIETVRFAIARAFLVTEEGRAARQAVRTLADAGGIKALNVLIAVKQLVWDGVDLGSEVEDRCFLALARAVREIPDPRLADAFASAASRYAEREDGKLHRDVLQALSQVLDARYETPAYACAQALELLSTAALLDVPTLKLCADIYISAEDKARVATAAIPLLATGRVRVAELLPGLGRALESEPLRVIDAVARRPQVILAELRGVVAPAKEDLRPTVDALTLLAHPEDAPALAGALQRLGSSYRTWDVDVLADAARRSSDVVRALLEVTEPSKAALMPAVLARCPPETIEQVVMAWLLSAPAEQAASLLSGIERTEKAHALLARLSETLCNKAQHGDVASSLRALTLLTHVRWKLTAEAGAAVASSVARLVDAVTPEEVPALRHVLESFGLQEHAAELIKRFVGTGDLDQLRLILPPRFGGKEAERPILRQRFQRAVAAGEHEIALELGVNLSPYSDTEVSDGLLTIVRAAPPSVARQAAIELAQTGNRDLAVVRCLARNVGKSGVEIFRLESAIAADGFADRITAGHLVEAVLNRQEGVWHAAEMIALMINRDATLWGLVADPVLDAFSDVASRAAHLCSQVLRKCADSKRSLLEDLERRVRSARSFRTVFDPQLYEVFLGRPILREASAWQLATTELSDDGDCPQLDAACRHVHEQLASHDLQLGTGCAIDAEIEQILRGYLTHERLALAVRAANALLASGRSDPSIATAVRRGLAGAAPIQLWSAFVLHALGLADEGVAAALLGMVESPDPTMGDGALRPAANLLRQRRRRLGIVEHPPAFVINEIDGVPQPPPPVPVGRDALRPSLESWGFERQGTLAVRLLVDMDVLAVVPTLFAWLDTEHRRQREALDYLKFLGALPDSRFTQWVLRTIEHEGLHEAGKASDELWAADPDEVAQLPPLLSRYCRHEAHWGLGEFGARIIDHVRANTKWLHALEPLLPAVDRMVLPELTTALLLNGCVSTVLAEIHVKALIEAHHLTASTCLARLAPVLNDNSEVLGAWCRALQDSNWQTRLDAIWTWVDAGKTVEVPTSLREALLNAVPAAAEGPSIARLACAFDGFSLLRLYAEAGAVGRRILALEPVEARDVETQRFVAQKLLKEFRSDDGAAFLERLIAVGQMGSELGEDAKMLLDAGRESPALRTTLFEWMRRSDVTDLGAGWIVDVLDSLRPTSTEAEDLLAWTLTALVRRQGWAELRLFGDFQEHPRRFTRPDDPNGSDAWADALDDAEVDRSQLARVLLRFAGAPTGDREHMARALASAEPLPAEVRRDVEQLVVRRPGDLPEAGLARRWLLRHLQER